MSPIKHRLNNRGDTIVEVMIVLAVLGMAIGISYATANRALLQARQAQENTKATLMLQAQTELLSSMKDNKALKDDGTSNAAAYIYRSGAFCINPGPVIVAGVCRVDDLYDLTINYHGTSDAEYPDTFVLEATWDNVQGQGKDHVTITYRVHPS